MKVVIAGGRDFNDYVLLEQFCDKILSNQKEVEIVSGTARGADSLGERYAQERKYNIKRFPADWGKHGKSAGYKRNAQMAEYADALIAFWDGTSKGTKHMIDLAKKFKLKVRVVTYNKPAIEKPPSRLELGEAFMFCEDCGARLHSFDGNDDDAISCPYKPKCYA